MSRLREFVAIASVSGDPTKRPQVFQSVGYIKRWCELLGGDVTLNDLGDQTMYDGTVLPLPPVLTATFGNDNVPKKTLCCYGHVDVQPASVSDGWDQPDPFSLTEVNIRTSQGSDFF